jgi:hypothetical protein
MTVTRTYRPSCRARTLALWLLFLGGAGVAVPSAQAFNTPCERSAGRMYLACEADAGEEYNVAIANCLNVAGFAELVACRRAASTAWGEARETCAAQREARTDVCDLLGEFRYDPDPLLDPDNEFVDPNDVPGDEAPNPLLSLEAGRVSVLRSGEEIVVILNTDESREILGVDCRVVAELAVEEEIEDGDEERGAATYSYAPLELTFDFIAQTSEGDLVYCGENTLEYEDGYADSTDGTFIAGIDAARSGYLLRSAPVVGQGHRQEYALGEAEDYITYEDLGATPSEEHGGENEAFPCEGQCTRTRDASALEPDRFELKFYRPGVGFVLALPFESGDDGDEPEWTGEREELACAGDALDLLQDEACGIGDPEALLETLCNLAGDAFCAD